MTKKEAFINFVNYFFEDSDVRFEKEDEFQLAKEFFEDFPMNFFGGDDFTIRIKKSS